MLNTYDDFIKYINENKVVPFSDVIEGVPSISTMTESSAWHTGIDESDPWRWKDIAVQNKDCAYGCLLGTKKGFISKAMLPVFYAAFSPVMTIDEIFRSGKLSKIVFDAYKIISSLHSIAIFDLRGMLGVSKKKGASALDGALVQLQQMAKVSICASRQKINKQGIPYGWRSNVYQTFERWAGNDIIKDAENYIADDAYNIILSVISDNFDVEEKDLKKLFKKLL